METESDFLGNIDRKYSAEGNIEEIKAPGQPEVVATTSSIIRVKWKPPTTDIGIDHFEIRYRIDKEKRGK